MQDTNTSLLLLILMEWRRGVETIHKEIMFNSWTNTLIMIISRGEEEEQNMQTLAHKVKDTWIRLTDMLCGGWYCKGSKTLVGSIYFL